MYIEVKWFYSKLPLDFKSDYLNSRLSLRSEAITRWRRQNLKYTKEIILSYCGLRCVIALTVWLHITSKGPSNGLKFCMCLIYLFGRKKKNTLDSYCVLTTYAMLAFLNWWRQSCKHDQFAQNFERCNCLNL